MSTLTYKSDILAGFCCILRLKCNSEDDEFSSLNPLVFQTNKTFSSVTEAGLGSFPGPFLFLMYHELIFSRMGWKRNELSGDKTGCPCE